jgi:predicted nucleic acid-binding protein
VIVADASAMLEVLLNTSRAAALRNLMLTEGQSIHVPHLMDVEVLQVLRRYVRTATLTNARAREAIQDYSDLPLKRYSHDILLERIWELRHNFTAYDAAYIALAEGLEAPLITCDRALTSGHRAEVVVF